MINERDVLRELAAAAADVLEFEETSERFSERTRELLRQAAYRRLKEGLRTAEAWFRENP